MSDVILALSGSLVLGAFHALSRYMRITSGRHLTTLSNPVRAYFGRRSRNPRVTAAGPAPIETLIILLLIGTAATYVVQLS